MVEPVWRRLGAHVEGTGVRFGLWAPRALAVSVIGDFNDWDRGAHPMRAGEDGTWHVHVHPLRPGELYQLAIQGPDGTWQDHADPLARRAQIPPQRSSVVESSSYAWQDADWLARRADRRPHAEPMRIYEVHLGSWRRGLSYRDLASELVAHVRDLGFTHVELMPLTEHPFHGSWGYQVSGYFAPTSRYGSPDDLRALVDAFHAADVAVLLDWVPAHFPRDEWALARLDGLPLYEPEDALLHPEWGTLPFDLGRPEVRELLVDSARYWLSEFHLDGLRVDAVEAILHPPHAGGALDPDGVRFLQELTTACYLEQPGIVMIAEDASTHPGVTAPVDPSDPSSLHLGFGAKWGLGWMHDTLRYLAEDPLWRQNHHRHLTLPMTYARHEHWVLPLSHDEVVHGKGPLLDRFPGDDAARRSTLRALLAWQWAHPGRPLVFMGTEDVPTGEWRHRRPLDAEPDAGMRALVRDLNRTHGQHRALWAADHAAEGFTWLVEHDPTADVFAFGRALDDDVVVVVANFAGVDQPAYRLPLPRPGTWHVVVTSADAAYGGDGGPREVVAGEPLLLPALSTLWLVPEGPR